MNFIQTFLLYLFIYFSSIFTYVIATEGLTIVENGWYGISTSKFNCLKQELSPQFIVINAGRAAESIKNAREAGIEDIDIYIYPCIKCGNNASETIINVLDELKNNNSTIRMIWLGITDYLECDLDKEYNIKYINEIINILNKRKQPFGIYSNKEDWELITGNIQKYKNIPLWYTNFDNENNFNDYINNQFDTEHFPEISESTESKNGKEGVEIDYLTSVDEFKCLKQNLSIEFVIVNVGSDINEKSVKNIKNAWAAGFTNIDILLSFCVKRLLKAITDILHYLKSNNAKFGRVWLCIQGSVGENNDRKKYDWYENQEKNIKFIDEVIEILKEKNIQYGFYSRDWAWEEITGAIQKYNNNIPIWYDHLDHKNNFNDYYYNGYSFGNWKHPTIKKYESGTSETCGIYAEYNWKP
ncbi:hypothetical protein Mgra_00008375 [Meloidogyne graminicola]|uniref:Lysozyme n=1 Tax=Meloidogyne graminicola TaxID=189291 RepID=A0A8S9ZFV8_9BILA|nr:hypothetical protein Mgra_00008375 [Meloidogyne graminicola]